MGAAALIAQLFTLFLPVYNGIRDEIRKEKGPDYQPTDAEMSAAFLANIEKGDSEWAAWLKAHPTPASGSSET